MAEKLPFLPWMKPACPYCSSHSSVSDFRTNFKYKIVSFGSYYRKSDKRRVSRYRCRQCGKCFSKASSDPCRHQRKRHLNLMISKLLVSGVSQRQIGRILEINRKTVVRKFLFLSKQAQVLLPQINAQFAKCEIIEFDDLETFEHTKCKPLSVTLAVQHKTRRILGLRVSRMPAKGMLAAISRKKYGPRKDERPEGRKKLFNSIESLITPNALIKSDENPHYPKDVQKHFPQCHHQRFKGRRGCIVGQGELKKIGFDPLFSLNHTCAKLRADINRLIRRTWCTTKLPERLEMHLTLAALAHNQSLS